MINKALISSNKHITSAGENTWLNEEGNMEWACFVNVNIEEKLVIHFYGKKIDHALNKYSD
jgi:hypothetical protein